MSDLLNNAITSIQLGIEDYNSNDERRPISAVRNFYAGVLLLGKQCLLSAAPDADPMEVLAAKYEPVPDGNGGVEHVPQDGRTIDVGELQGRFKTFGLKWPEGDFKKLQRLRNELEHFHSSTPKANFPQVIAECFPLVAGFFEILDLDPANELGDAWAVMLAQDAFFKKKKAECDATLVKVEWPEALSKLHKIECPTCGSALMFQKDADNDEAASIEGGCKACGTDISAENFVEAVVEAEYGINAYLAAKDGLEPEIHDCPECYNSTYAGGQCWFCQYEVSGECARCGEVLSVSNLYVDSASLCDYCGHVSSKDD